MCTKNKEFKKAELFYWTVVKLSIMGPETRRRLFYYVVIFCGEFIATAFLMIFGCMGMDEKVMNPTHSALAWGFTVTALITVMYTSFSSFAKCHNVFKCQSSSRNSKPNSFKEYLATPSQSLARFWKNILIY